MGRRLTPREQLEASVSEADWQRTVVEIAQWSGWWVHHQPDSRRSEAGLPDLLLVRAPRVVFAELKKKRGRFSLAQDLVLAMLDRCPGVEVYRWQYGVTDVDEVKRVLVR